jgi:hypothetical protein
VRKYRYRYSNDQVFGHKNWKPPFPVATGVSPRHFKCPLPRNDADFAILSEIFFGVPLSLSVLWIGGSCGQAEIAQRYDSFATADGFFGKMETAGYDRLSWFWDTVVGPMSGSRSLTHTGFRILTHRQGKRIANWIKRRRDTRGSTPSIAFVRLAHRFGVGENIIGRVDRRSDDVLTGGRVDGALAASIPEVAQ